MLRRAKCSPFVILPRIGLDGPAGLFDTDEVVAPFKLPRLLLSLKLPCGLLFGRQFNILEKLAIEFRAIAFFW